MKELAIVKLAKDVAVKVKEKVKKKVADKKKVWAEQAAISVEENKRREVEFKEDFKGLKESVTQGAQKAKEEVQKGVETIEAKVEETHIKEKISEGAAKVKSEVQKGVDATAKATESVKEKVEAKVSTKKEEPAAKEVAEKKETPKKEVAKKSTDKPAAEAKKEAPKKETTAKKTAAKSASSKKESGSKRDAKIALYSENITKFYGKVDTDFLTIVVKNLGPSIYKKDAELVSCSDPKELDTVRKNFLVKKLGMTESEDVLNEGIKEVCAELKESHTKYRATFYYALAKKFKQESKLS